MNVFEDPILGINNESGYNTSDPFCPLNKVFKSIKLDKKIYAYGGIKEVIHMGTGGMHGFPFGFVVGCIYYKRGYQGPIEYTRMYAEEKYGNFSLEEFI